MVRHHSQRGSVFLITILILAVLVALGYALNTQVARMIAQIHSRSDRMNAQYLAQAGLRHHLWQARNDKGNYQTTVTGKLVGHGNYSSTLVKDASSNVVVHITSTGTTFNGATATLARTYKIACTAYLKTTWVIDAFDNKGHTANIISGTNLTPTGSIFQLDDATRTAKKRAVMRFSSSAFPGAGTTIVSATLMLDVLQHSPSTEGGQIYASSLKKRFLTDRVSWTDATGSRDPWLSPGGDYPSFDEGMATITATTKTYNLDVTKIVDGWINSSLTNPNHGFLIHINRDAGDTQFRLDAGSPRIEIRHC